jgi:hypothetical protein
MGVFMTIAEDVSSQAHSFCERLRVDLAPTESLEEAAQRCVESFAGAFGANMPLVRMYATAPFDELPRWRQDFARRVAAEHGLSAEVSGATPILCLLASRGIETAWNDPRSSVNHAALPLIDPRSLAATPMIARLLSDTGVIVHSVPGPSGPQYTELFEQRRGGLFCVEDARTAVDDADRPVIPAREFVDKYAIESVFGVGGVHLTGRPFFVLIAFSRERIRRQQLAPLMEIVHAFKAATVHVVVRNRVFR